MVRLCLVLLVASGCGRIGFVDGRGDLDVPAGDAAVAAASVVGITSHAQGALVNTFEASFSGFCDAANSLSVTPGPKVSIIDASCTADQLLITTGFEHTTAGTESRSFTATNGTDVLEFSVSFVRDCPVGFIGVPGDPTPEIDIVDFCLAKYQMKATTLGALVNGGNGTMQYDPVLVAESRFDGTPWASITRDQAIASCQALGVDYYDLVSNPQWQTVARNIERTAVNWHATIGTIDQVVGVGMIARGHSDGNADGFGRTGMNSMLAADSDDANGYLGTGQSATDAWASGSGSSSGEQLRTQRLSNGEVVWDLAGNGWEWVSTSILGSDLVPPIGNSGWREFTDTTDFPATSSNKTLFGPAGQLDSQHGVGQLYGGTANQLARGHWGSGGQGSAYAGVFSLGLNGASGPNKTFRCVYR